MDVKKTKPTTKRVSMADKKPISSTRIIPPKTVALATKLGVNLLSPNEVVTRVWDIECGLHSGIPECCIAFYVREFRPACAASINDEVPLLRKYTKLRKRAIARDGLAENYRPCFECLAAKRFIVPTLCDCEARAEPARQAGQPGYPFCGKRVRGCRVWNWAKWF